MAVFYAYSGTWTLKLMVTEGDYDIEKNTSPLTFKLQLISGGYDFWMYALGASITVDGKVVASRSRTDDPQMSCGVNETINIINNATYTVTHDNDGSKEVSIGFTLDMAKAYYTPGTMSSSGNILTLTTIPRATTPSVPASMIMGQPYSISLTSRASSGFTHTLIYEFGGSSDTIISKTSLTSVSWTPPLSLANQIPSDTKETGTITCHTYSGSTLIGTKEVVFSLSVPSSVKPSVNSISHSETVSNLFSKFGGYVQSKSRIKISVSASGIYGSSISGCSAVVNGVSYTASKSGNYWVFTTDPIDKSGYIPISVTVTDSRGRSSGATDFSDVISQLAYSNPTITKFNVARIDENGELFDEGKRLKIEIQYAVSSVNDKNTVEVAEILYKRKTETLWDNLNFIPFSSPPYSLNGVYNLLGGSYPEFSIDYGYDIRLRIGDYFTESNPIILTTDIPTDIVLLDLRSTGKGVGVGIVSQKDAMEVAMPVEFLDDITADVSKTPFAAKSHTHNSLQSITGTTMKYQSAAALSVSEIDYIAGFKDGNTLAPISGGNVRQFLGVPYCVSDGSYYGLALPNGNTDAYLRAPKSGFIPYENGGSGYLGTPGWPWNYVYGKKIYGSNFRFTTIFSGNLSSNGSTATLTNALQYAMLCINGFPGSGESLTWCTLPALTSSYTMQLTSNMGYIAFTLTASGNNIILKKTGGSSGSWIWAVYGVTRFTE